MTVVDNTDPTLSVPANTTVECPGDTSTAANGTATVADNCNMFTVTHSDSSTPGCGDTEVIMRTWTATDECGNSTDCVQTITVVDTTTPTVTAELVPVPGTLKKKKGCFTITFSSTDACDADPTLTAVLNGHTVTNGQLVKRRGSG